MKTNVRMYSFQYKVFAVSYYSFKFPDIFERRLALLVFMYK